MGLFIMALQNTFSIYFTWFATCNFSHKLLQCIYKKFHPSFSIACSKCVRTENNNDAIAEKFAYFLCTKKKFIAVDILASK